MKRPFPDRASQSVIVTDASALASARANDGNAVRNAHYQAALRAAVTHCCHGQSRSARTTAKLAKSRRHWQHAASNDAPHAAITPLR
jgi:hypothetical protein